MNTSRASLLRQRSQHHLELARIDAELATLEATGDAAPDTYRSDGVLPPGWSRRRFLERVRTLPGAVRTGGARGRGVVWAIARADFEAQFTTRSSLPMREPAKVVDIDAWIAESGARLTRTA